MVVIGACMEWGFVLGLSAITLAVISLLVYVGLRVSRAAERHSSEIDLPLYVTPAGTALFACLVTFWIVCVVARATRPESTLGVFLHGPGGVLAVVTGSVFFAGIAAAILNQLGYPVAKKDKSS